MKASPVLGTAEVRCTQTKELELQFPDLPPFGDDAYMDGLSSLKEPPSAEMIRLMSQARAVDSFSKQVVDCVAFGLRVRDIGPADFAVVVNDVQEIDWTKYEFLRSLGRLPGGNGTARQQVRLIFCATEPGLRITTGPMTKSRAERVYMVVDAAGAMADGANTAPAAPNRGARRGIGRKRKG